MTIYRTNASEWWYVDVSVRNSDFGAWTHIWTVDIKDQQFSYMREWNIAQKIMLAPDNWGDSVQINVWVDEWNSKKTQNSETITRTVITAVPNTWPRGNLVWIIVATLVIFGGYVYIKKRADI